MRSFKLPRLWLGLWCAGIITVIVVCLGPPPKIPQLPSNSDKLEHFLAYFLLSSGAVQLFARRRALLMAAVGLVLLGIAIEFAQGAWTTDRSADPQDAVANTCGVLLGLCLIFTPMQHALLWLERRLFGGESR